MSTSEYLAVDREQAGAVVSDSPLRPARPRAAAAPASVLTRDFLTWVANGPRCYAEAMEAWRSSCPRFTIWEDALSDGLVRLEGAGGRAMSDTRVVLTGRGRAVLDEA
jgi:hypothetical protein